MNNGITNRQMFQNNLDRLTAQRVLYSSAKTVMGIQLILCVPVIILFSLSAQYLKSSCFVTQFNRPIIDISWIVAALGVSIALFDGLCLSPIIVKLKELAAKIQELFDCDVLHLDWNTIATGSKPNAEDIIENATKYKKIEPDFKSLQNWYARGIGEIELGVARILCQRSNIRWDIDLRKKVNVSLYILTTLTFIVLLLIGIIGEFNINKFIMVVIAPCLPIFQFSIRYVYFNKKAIVFLKNLKHEAEKAWNDASNSNLSNVQLEDTARKLQDMIYINRKTNPLIFDKIYSLYKSKQENSMNYSCDQMISEYKNRIS